MKPFRHAIFAVCIAAVTLCAHGCGTSGSKPIFFAEVIFEIAPSAGGEAQFTVESISAGGVKHDVPETLTAPFNIVLENAAPPYEARFKRAGSEEISVHLIRIPATGLIETQVTDSTDAGKDTAIVTATEPDAVAVTPGIPNPEVRINVCAPFDQVSGCFPGEGTNGLPFAGTLGDAFITRLIVASAAFSPMTPSIYFLEGARDSVSAVLRGVGNLLRIELVINGTLRQASAGTGDVVVREDL